MTKFDKTILYNLLPENPTILDVGAWDGKDGLEIHQMLGGTLHSFDPCSHGVFKGHNRKNVFFYDFALGNKNGSITLYHSPHSQSNSIRKPKNHISAFPEVEFTSKKEVAICKLDTIWNTDKIDFIWCDVNGAEEDFIKGSIKTLARTHYLYIEFSNVELYEGQCNLKWLLCLLPDWKLIETYNEGKNFGNALLVNEKFK